MEMMHWGDDIGAERRMRFRRFAQHRQFAERFLAVFHER